MHIRGSGVSGLMKNSLLKQYKNISITLIYADELKYNESIKTEGSTDQPKLFEISQTCHEKRRR